MTRNPARTRGALALALLGAATAVAGEAAPRIHCPHPTQNFGPSHPSHTVTAIFVLANTGQADLVISDVLAPAAISAADLPRRSIPPRESADLTVRLPLAGYRGEVRKTLKVRSNDPVQPELALTIEGRVAGDLEISPAAVYLESADALAAQRATVNLRWTGEGDFSIREVTANSPLVETALETVETGRHYRIRVGLKPGRLAGRLERTLYVLTRHPEYPEIAIPLTAVIRAPVVFAQTVIVVPESGAAATRHVLLESGTVSNWRVVAVEPPDPAIQVSLNPAGPGRYHLILGSIPPGAAINGKTLRVKTDIPGAPEIAIPFQTTPARDPLERAPAAP